MTETAPFSAALSRKAKKLVTAAGRARLRLATAESCTGGLVIGCLTEVPGASDVVDRGFVTYSNESKTGLLGVTRDMLASHGAVSAEVAAAMAEGALARSGADIAVAVTGVAGPGAGSDEKPVGLVYLAARRGDGKTAARCCEFGDIGRHEVRLKAVAVALDLIRRLIG